MTRQKRLYLWDVLTKYKSTTSVSVAKANQQVCIKIDGNDHSLSYERHFDSTDLLYSNLSRESIDILKAYFKEEMNETHWKLVIKLKKTLNIK